MKNSEWMNLEVFMKFNKLAGILSAAFGRVDTYDLFTALAALPSDLIEVQETGLFIVFLFLDNNFYGFSLFYVSLSLNALTSSSYNLLLGFNKTLSFHVIQFNNKIV